MNELLNHPQTLPALIAALDTHVQARLSDVDERGRAQVLSVGWLAASHRAVDDKRSTATETVHEHGSPVALTPGVEVRLRISLTPFAQLLRRSHRLRLELGSDPRALAAPPAQGFVYFDVAGPPYPARNTISHSDATLRLSVRGEPPW